MRTPFNFHFSGFNISTLCLFLFQFDFVQLRTKHLHGTLSVVLLRTGFRTLNLDSGRLVIQLHFGFYLVYVLSSGSTGTRSRDFDIGRVYINFDTIINQWININRSKGCMAFGIAIKRRNTHQTMDTVFAFEITKRIIAFKFQCYGFDSGHITFLIVQFLDFETVFFAPHHVHTH